MEIFQGEGETARERQREAESETDAWSDGDRERGGPVPARYVRQSQMCPQLDMSDKNDKKRQDMSDKARCVRQKIHKIARYVRQMCQTKMKTKCKICLTGHNYNFQALIRAFKPTYSNYTSILVNTQYNTLGSWAKYVSNYMLLDKSNVHACD